MDRRPTPDPGSTENTGEPDYAAARRHLKQQPLAENEGLTSEDKRSPDTPDVEGNPARQEREAAAQRGRAAN